MGLIFCTNALNRTAVSAAPLRRVNQPGPFTLRLRLRAVSKESYGIAKGPG